MEDVNVLGTLKIQGYLNNQHLDSDTENFLNNFKFKDLVSDEEYQQIEYSVRQYNDYKDKLITAPDPEISDKMQSLSENVLYLTGQEIDSVHLSDFKTQSYLNGVMQSSGVTSNNDLYVIPNYEDFSRNTDYIKVTVTGHDNRDAMGINAGAKMLITKNGDIITTKNALYYK